MNKPQQHIAVLGAGMVGVSTAIWLQRAGHAVTLIDREGVAAGASYGNAGILASSGIIPVNSPGLLLKAPAMLLDPNQPLFLKGSYLPRLFPWLIKFLAKANHKDMAFATSALYNLMYDSVEQHKALAKGTGAEKFIQDSGLLHGYTSEKQFQKSKSNWQMLQRLGIDFVEMTSQDIEHFDPSLKGKFGYGIYAKNDGQITDPGAYIRTLADYFTKNGGELKIAEVENIAYNNDAMPNLKFLDGSALEAKHLVVTAGAHSARLMHKLGYHIPLESERGYHLEFVNPNIELKSPVLVVAEKFGMNSMNGRLRCAGIVEFGGLEAKPRRAPFELLRKKVKELFPELTYDEVHEWMGHRPTTSDAMPLIGAFEHHPNIWAGFGHQHLGLTGGPRTGKLLAEMISGKKPNEDVSAFNPNRF